jgi:hypothetical protein
MSMEEDRRSHAESHGAELLVAEYTSLREEIIKRIEIQHQLLSLALIAPGTILAIGLQSKNASLLLLYPILGMFLAAVWLSNSFAIGDLAAYIQSDIQPNVGAGHAVWERVRASTDTRHLALLHFWGTRGLFFGTELVALVAGITLATVDAVQVLFLIAGGISCVLTLLLLSVPQRKRRRK